MTNDTWTQRYFGVVAAYLTVVNSAVFAYAASYLSNAWFLWVLVIAMILLTLFAIYQQLRVIQENTQDYPSWVVSISGGETA